MALPLAVLGLVIVAALVAAGFAGALVEQRVGRNGVYAVQAGGAADAGVAAVLTEWDGYGLSALAPGDSAALPSARLPGRAGYSATVARLNGELFRILVEGGKTDADGESLAVRKVGLIVRVADSAGAGVGSVVPLADRPWVGIP